MFPFESTPIECYFCPILIIGVYFTPIRNILCSYTSMILCCNVFKHSNIKLICSYKNDLIEYLCKLFVL